MTPGLIFPLWALSILIVIALPCAAYIGWRTGRATYFARGYDTSPPSSYPGDTSRGAMLAMLGLLLAFTFGFALTRAEARKINQINEATAISTAFLKADLLEDPGRTALRSALLDYAATRVVDHAAARREGFDTFMARTIAEQASLWPDMMNAFGDDTPPPIKAMIAGSMTQVLDAHTYRLTAGTDYVPLVAKVMLLIVAMACLFFVGNNSGLRGRALTWRTFIFAGAQAVVMIVILDFERGQEGFITLNTTIMEMTIADMEAQSG
ncbi:MAG: hypothetical protein AAGA28_01020 [Pseudomonadota bacterium]